MSSKNKTDVYLYRKHFIIERGQTSMYNKGTETFVGLNNKHLQASFTRHILCIFHL